MKISGGCLCNTVRYEGEVTPQFSGNCHCSVCRKLSGSGHLALMVVSSDQIRISGRLKSHDNEADSGAVVKNHFCANCGVQIMKTGELMPDMLFLIASTLDDPELFRPDTTVFASRALSWDKPNADTVHFDTMPS